MRTYTFLHERNIIKYLKNVKLIYLNSTFHVRLLLKSTNNMKIQLRIILNIVRIELGNYIGRINTQDFGKIRIYNEYC